MAHDATRRSVPRNPVRRMALIARFKAAPPVLRGALWMVCSAGCFTCMTTLIRLMAGEIHPFQNGFVRVVVNLLLILPFAFRTGRTVFYTTNHKAYALRGFIGFTFVLTYFPGAQMISVPESQALAFTSPLWATVLAVIFLGERLRLRRTIAVLVGFAGALVILRPGFNEFSLGAILVLIAAMANASSNVIVRHTTQSDHPDKVVLFLMLWVTPLMAVPAAFVWQSATWEQWAYMIGIGAFATLNQRLLSRAFQAAPATAILPFDFFRLPFAAILGYAVFAALPDGWVWLGGAIIFGSSVYVAHREAVAHRRRARS
jgi:drug/metabolite transporter (DMT)-like permease